MRFLIPTALLLAGCDGESTKDTGADGNTTNTSNRQPVAEAGSSITQTADTPVSLNGGASSDPDGDALTYVWAFARLPEGSELASKEAPFTTNHSATPQTSFVADRVGTYIVALVVNDGTVDSASDFVVITVTEPENLPVANAGEDITSSVGALTSLDASASYDPQGKALTYAWTLVDKPTASALGALTGNETATPTFTPDARGTYTAALVVNNGLASSTADAVVITVTGEDSAPTANAGPDQEVEDCSTVRLDCSSSVDPDGDTLAYQWAIQSKPATSATSDSSFSPSSTDGTPTFFPDVSGTYVLSCAVSDGQNWSTPDVITLEAAERRANTEPIADAGSDVAVSAGNAVCEESGYTYDCEECEEQTVTLGSDARASDPDGDPYTLVWSVEEGSAKITDPNQLSTTVTLSDAEPTEPDECEDVEYRVLLTVTDCTGEVSTDTVKFVATCCGVTDTGP